MKFLQHHDLTVTVSARSQQAFGVAAKESADKLTELLPIQNEKAAVNTSRDLRPIWLPTVDTLRNLFYAPTVDLKITFELLRQGSLAG